MSAAAKSGHPTSSMSAADLAAVLVDGYLRFDFADPKSPANDRLVFSKGHASVLLYAIFRAAGVVSDEDILEYRTLGSMLEGHPTPAIPWVDVATGSLGQGLPIGVGMALAAKHLEHLPNRVWVLCGDSEMAEGSMWEAFEHAAHFGLDNLTAIIDVNRLGQRGETMVGWDLDTYVARAEAFGWNAIPLDGHDLDAIDAALGQAVATTGKPTVLVARTMKGKGVAAVENQNGYHGKPFDDPDAAIAELGGVSDVRIEIAKPEAAVSHKPAGGTPRAPSLRARHRGRHAQGVRRRARSARCRSTRRRRARRRGLQFHVRRDLREGASRALLRDVHRGAAARRRRGRPPGRRLATVRVDVRGLPLTRVRLRAHGGHQPRDVLALRLARRRLDRRGRPVADGTRGHRLAPCDPWVDRAPSL